MFKIPIASLLFGLLLIPHVALCATRFDFLSSAGPNPAPRLPRGEMVEYQGNLLGVAQFGGTGDFGAVFRFNRTANTLHLLHSFTGGAGGFYPSNGLVDPGDGFYYGTTSGGNNSNGILFRVNAAGQFLIIHHFGGLGQENQIPAGLAIPGPNGFLYGPLAGGGAQGLGGIYRIQPNGSSFSLIRSFTGTSGATPGKGNGASALTSDGNGNLYGVCETGGSNDTGVVYRTDANGAAYTLLHTFSAAGLKKPQSRLLLASNGFLYGTADLGGAGNEGGVFRIRTDGTGYQVLHEFTASRDGFDAFARLIEGSDGYIYGTAFRSSNNAAGTVFRIPKAGGGFSVLHRSVPGPANTGQISAPLFQTGPGVFYGSSTSAGADGSGGFFRVITSLAPPQVFLSGRKRPVFRRNKLRLKGTSVDDIRIVRVEHATKSTWNSAVGTTTWAAKIRVPAKASRVTIRLRSIDSDGLSSPIRKVRARRVR